MSRVGWGHAGALMVALVLGCGGEATHTPKGDSGPASGAGAGGQSDGTGGSLAVAGTPEMPHGDAGVGGRVEGGDAGQAGQAMTPDPLIRSATRYCEDGRECFGLACVAPPNQPSFVCVAPCASDEDCQPDESCLGRSGLEKACYARCDSPVDCAYRFDCFDFDEQGKLVCFPLPWVRG